MLVNSVIAAGEPAAKRPRTGKTLAALEALGATFPAELPAEVFINIFMFFNPSDPDSARTVIAMAGINRHFRNLIIDSHALALSVALSRTYAHRQFESAQAFLTSQNRPNDPFASFRALTLGDNAVGLNQIQTGQAYLIRRSVVANGQVSYQHHVSVASVTGSTLQARDLRNLFENHHTPALVAGQTPFWHFEIVGVHVSAPRAGVVYVSINNASNRFPRSQTLSVVSDNGALCDALSAPLWRRPFRTHRRQLSNHSIEFFALQGLTAQTNPVLQNIVNLHEGPLGASVLGVARGRGLGMELDHWESFLNYINIYLAPSCQGWHPRFFTGHPDPGGGAGLSH